MNGELEYLRCLKYISENGTRKSNRTGTDAFTVPHMMLQHDMSNGFPLITTKNVSFKPIRVELEFFIKGLTDKKWLQDRGCRIWDQWCRPSLVPKDLSEEDRKQFQEKEMDLGPIYGSSWRDFGEDIDPNLDQLAVLVSKGKKDQLMSIVNTLKENPNDRRMICSAWNPELLDEMALPPCHVMWHITHINGTLNLSWMQRSCDFLLGIPYNLASYSLLLHLLCKESGMKEGLVTGFLSDCHIYENHVDQVKEQLSRTPYDLPRIETKEFTSIFNWTHEDTKSIGYKKHPKIQGDVAV